MKKNKWERDEDSIRHGDQYDTQLLWFLMRHMRNRRPQRVSSQTLENYSQKNMDILDLWNVPGRPAVREESKTQTSPGALRILLMKMMEVQTTSSACPPEPPTHTGTHICTHKHTCTLYCPLIDAQRKASTIDTLAHSSRRATFLFFI